jgi:hypothetical protein
VFAEIGDQMGAGLAVGLDQSAPRVAQAAQGLVSDVAGSFDDIVSQITDADWASKFSNNVETSLGNTQIDTSNRDLLGQQRIANGELSQSTVLLSVIVAELRALRAQAGKGDSAVGATASSRRLAELGAF